MNKDLEKKTEELKGKFLWTIGEEDEGIVIIPMNEEKRIHLHGNDEIKFFIQELGKFIQE